MSEIPKSSLIDIKALWLEYAFEKGVNFGARTITISGDIDSDSFKSIDAALTEMEQDPKRQITIKINSTGGFVYDALAIVGRIKSSKCTIRTIGYGAIMSAATLILAAGSKRKISKYAWFMVHEANFESSGSVSEHAAIVAQAKREESQWASHMQLLSKTSKQWWLDAVQNKNTYLTAEDLLTLGVVDEVI